LTFFAQITQYKQDMKRINKKPDLLIIKKTPAPESPSQSVTPANAVDNSQPIINTLSPSIEQQTNLAPQIPITEYYPSHLPVWDYYPLVQSVGNSGWQVSEIWRDLRVDGVL